mmetsp:Transcript_18134/g.59563  ORF Transcript_18134/g.59563 Transcript_18134/m.59563 type:complete len:169 (-) Transcript_18134:22-528(-)
MSMFDNILLPEHRKTTDNHEPSTQVTTPFPNASGSVIPTPSRKITVGEPFAVRLVPRKRKQGDSSIESSLNMREELKISREDVEKFFDMPQPDAAVALGISLSTLKNVCRKIGVYRWPYQRQYGGIKQRTSKAWLGADAWMEEALEHVEDQNRFSDFDVPRPKMCCVE